MLAVDEAARADAREEERDTMRPDQTGWRAEPPIEEVMADPAVRAVMRSDGLRPEDVWRVVERAAAGLRARAPTAADAA